MQASTSTIGWWKTRKSTNNSTNGILNALKTIKIFDRYTGQKWVTVIKSARNQGIGQCNSSWFTQMTPNSGRFKGYLIQLHSGGWSVPLYSTMLWVQISSSVYLVLYIWVWSSYWNILFQDNRAEFPPININKFADSECAQIIMKLYCNNRKKPECNY